MKYNVYLNNGNEYIGVNEKTITANEVVETVNENILAREISHQNPLIPEQVASAVLQNFCKAAVELMSMGFAIVLRNGADAALRIYPDIHIDGGNINLARAKELDPTVTELTLENAGDLVSKAGITVRAKAECEQKFTELLKSMDASITRKDVIERAKVVRKDGEGGGTGGSGSSSGGSGSGGTTPDPGTGGGGSGDNGGGGGDNTPGGDE